jgi:hypothetical protein
MWGRLSSLPVRRTFQSGLGRLESRPNWQTRMSAPGKQPAASVANFGIQDKYLAYEIL